MNTELFSRIKLVIFDIDGVLTDGRLRYGPDGEQLKVFNVKDGVGLKALMAHGIEVAVITGRACDALSRRMQDLAISHFWPGCHDKLAAYSELTARLGLSDTEVAYVGDDIIDLPVMQRVGLRIVPADGWHYMREQVADWVTHCSGGDGVAREVADRLLGERGLSPLEAYQVLLGDKQRLAQ